MKGLVAIVGVSPKKKGVNITRLSQLSSLMSCHVIPPTPTLRDRERERWSAVSLSRNLTHLLTHFPIYRFCPKPGRVGGLVKLRAGGKGRGVWWK